MKNRSREEKRKRRKKGEIFERSNSEDRVKTGGEGRRNYSGYIVR